MEIRKATEADAPEIVTCVVAAFRDYMTLISRTPGPMLEDYWEGIQKHHTFVAVENEKLLGVLLLKDGEGTVMWLEVLATDPRLHGKGVGRALIQYADDYARSLGKTEMRLYTHVKYERTAGIYHRMGYETYDRVQEYGFDRYYLKKALV